ALRGPQQAAWLDRLEDDRDNLRAALGWGLASGAIETTARMAAALFRFWLLRAHFAEGHYWLGACIPRSEEFSPPVPGKICLAMGLAVHNLRSGEYSRAHPFLTESVALFRSAGDRLGAAYALAELGHVENRLQMDNRSHDFAVPAALLAESLALFDELGDT